MIMLLANSACVVSPLGYKKTSLQVTTYSQKYRIMTKKFIKIGLGVSEEFGCKYVSWEFYTLAIA